MENTWVSVINRKIEAASVNFTKNGEMEDALDEILSPEAQQFLVSLHLRFNATRKNLLARREQIAQELDSGASPDFPAETEWLRNSQWKVAPIPKSLYRRHTEITAPCEAKMMIHALNSGADLFMADIEDSLSPTWGNVIQAQMNLKSALAHTLTYSSPDGKLLTLNEKTAVLAVRPRGWHMEEKNFTINGEAISASLFDFGLYLFHCGRVAHKKGLGPYFYLPKMESHLEARLWNEVFVFAQDSIGIPVGSIRATVLIETILAAYEMDEILFELKDHAAGLNAGRWDYLFSVIKKLRRLNPLFPDRDQLTMKLPFMQAYCELLVQTCHKRGAHAIGGMSAFIPSRKNPEINASALQKITEDKNREVALGFDGTWVAHPDLVKPVKAIFEAGLKNADDQKHIHSERKFKAEELLPSNIPSTITDEGVVRNVNVTLTYLNRWLDGQGAVAINNLMEDAATAEISRAQLWQWIQRSAPVAEGYLLSSARFLWILNQELNFLSAVEEISQERKEQLHSLMEHLVLNDQFVPFLTLPAYEFLQQQIGGNPPAITERGTHDQQNVKPLARNSTPLLNRGSGASQAIH